MSAPVLVRKLSKLETQQQWKTLLGQLDRRTLIKLDKAAETLGIDFTKKEVFDFEDDQSENQPNTSNKNKAKEKASNQEMVAVKARVKTLEDGMAEIMDAFNQQRETFEGRVQKLESANQKLAALIEKHTREHKPIEVKPIQEVVPVRSGSTSPTSRPKATSPRAGIPRRKTVPRSPRSQTNAAKSKKYLNVRRPSAVQRDRVAKVQKQEARRSRIQHYPFGTQKVQVMLPTNESGLMPNAKQASKLPAADLKLKWANGYKGRDAQSRQNMYLSKDGTELIYYIAAVGVVYNTEDQTQRFFVGHDDDITCIAMDTKPGSTLVATGQTDPKDTAESGNVLPKIMIWDYKTCELKCTIKDVSWGMVQKVAFSSFQSNSMRYVYSIGGNPDHTLAGWNLSKIKNGKLEADCSRPTTKDEIFGMKVNPIQSKNSDVLDEILIFCRSKVIYMTTCVVKGKLTMKSKNLNFKEAAPKSKPERAFLCAEYLSDGRYVIGAASGAIFVGKGDKVLMRQVAHKKVVGDISVIGSDTFVTASFDSKLTRWFIDAYEEGKKPSLKAIDSCGPLTMTPWGKNITPKTIDFDKKTSTVYIGTKENKIVKYKMDTKEMDICMDGHDGDIHGLATHPTKPLYVTGGYDGLVKIWCQKTHKCLAQYECPTKDPKKPHNVTCCAWSPNGELIAVGTATSKIYLLVAEGLKPQFINVIPPRSSSAKVEPIANIRFSPCGTLLGVTHFDSRAYVLSVCHKDTKQHRGYALKRWKHLDHRAATSHLQFSADSDMLKVFTRDYEVVHWKLDKTAEVATHEPRIPDPDTCKWDGNPLIAGWDTQGLYQKGWDGTDLNDCAISKDKSFIASGDDFGLVRLHAYPAIKQEAHKKYQGHSSFVVGIDWTGDNQTVITCGGADMAVFEWGVDQGAES